MIEALRSRLSKRKNKHLSIEGRVAMLKLVLYRLFVYFISFFKTPTDIISKLKSLLKVRE